MKYKKEKKKYGLILFIVFIMIGTTFSFVFFGFSPMEERVKYNGIYFTNDNNKWTAKINGRYAAFSFPPKDVETIAAPKDLLKKLQNLLELDVTYDLNNTFAQSIALAHHQMGLTLEQYNIFVRKGFTTNNTYNMPIIKCSDSTLNVPVIYFKYGNITNIHSEENCIIAEASTNTDFIKIKDRILYGILGIIK